MLTFDTLALEAYFFLPGSAMCYRKINDRQAVCFPQSEKQIVTFPATQEVEYAHTRTTHPDPGSAPGPACP